LHPGRKNTSHTKLGMSCSSSKGASYRRVQVGHFGDIKTHGVSIRFWVILQLVRSTEPACIPPDIFAVQMAFAVLG